MKLLQKYTLAVVSFAVTLALTVTSFLLTLSIDTSYLTFAFGAIVTLSATLLQVELDAMITKKFAELSDIHKFLSAVDDDNLRSEVLGLAHKLSQGVVPYHIASLRSRYLLDTANKSIQACGYPKVPERFYLWEDDARLKSWYKGYCNAVKRGVEVEYVYIFDRSTVITSDGQWDIRTSRILKKQQEDGINIRLAWREDIYQTERRPANSLLQEYVIFDGNEVLEVSPDHTQIFRRPSEKVKDFLDTFKELRKYSQDFPGSV